MINESGFKIFSNPLTSRCVPFKTSWVKRRNPIRGGEKNWWTGQEEKRP